MFWDPGAAARRDLSQKGVIVMEALLPVVFLNLCGILLKSRFDLGSAESYLIALMGSVTILYIGGIFNVLWPVTAGLFLTVAVLFMIKIIRLGALSRGGACLQKP